MLLLFVAVAVAVVCCSCCTTKNRFVLEWHMVLVSVVIARCFYQRCMFYCCCCCYIALAFYFVTAPTNCDDMVSGHLSNSRVVCAANKQEERGLERRRISLPIPLRANTKCTHTHASKSTIYTSRILCNRMMNL